MDTKDVYDNTDKVVYTANDVSIGDLDGDGCSEMAIRTCEGTVFGDGTQIGDTDIYQWHQIEPLVEQTSALR